MYKNKVMFFTKDQNKFNSIITRLEQEDFNVIINSDNIIESIMEIFPNVIIIDSEQSFNSMVLVKSINDDGSINMIPTIVIGLQNENTKIKTLLMGAIDYIGKPFNEDELFYKVRNLANINKNVFKCNMYDSLTGKGKIYTKSDIALNYDKKKLLIIDDEKIILSILSTRYKNKGYEVYSMQDPIEALEFFKKNPIDIIITDFYMPTMQGDELIKEVKKINNDIKIIVLSGQKSEELMEKLWRLEVDDYVAKPFSPVDLDLRIRKLLGQR